jgi:L-alanine-DL-glutamate epimerase-like enolase superfamily enzyme
MKIIGIKTTIVAVPHNEPEFMSTGMRRGVNEVLVEIETDEGITGLGECIATCAPVIEAGVNFCKPLLLGRDPRNIEGIVNNLRHVGNWHYFDKVGNVVLAGIETALWDIFGRFTGQPLYFLLGGLVREQIPLMYYLFRFDIQEMVRRAKKAVGEGYKTVYFKVGQQDLSADAEAVEAVRAAVGTGVQVRIDANEMWTVGTAIRFIKQIEKYDVEWVEQPCLSKNIDELAHIRRSVNTPIGADQSAWTFYDVRQVLQKQAADVLIIDQYQVGGLLAYKKCAALAEAYGIPLNHHSFGDLGVGFAAALHVIASTPGFLYANQSFLTIHEDDIIQGGLPKVVDGCVQVPHGPGLGVELDAERVAQAAERYQREGAYAVREAHSDRVTFVPMI